MSHQGDPISTPDSGGRTRENGVLFPPHSERRFSSSSSTGEFGVPTSPPRNRALPPSRRAVQPIRRHQQTPQRNASAGVSATLSRRVVPPADTLSQARETSRRVRPSTRRVMSPQNVAPAQVFFTEIGYPSCTIWTTPIDQSPSLVSHNTNPGVVEYNSGLHQFITYNNTRK